GGLDGRFGLVGRTPGAWRLRDAGRLFDRPTEGRGLVLGLLELRLGNGSGDDPGAGVDVRLSVLEDRAPDRDRGVEVAVVPEVADSAAVEAADVRFGCRREAARP